MNVRENQVKKPTQDPSTKSAPDSQTTPPPVNQTDAGTAHTSTSQRWAINRTKLHLRFNRWRETWVPLMNLAIAFFAFVVIVFQVRIYNKQSRLMEAQTQLIQTQTQIMEKSLGLSANSVRISERAYVSVANLSAKLADKQVLIALGNNGTVPATAINLEANVYRTTPASASEPKEGKTSKVLWDAGAMALFPGNFRMSIVIALEGFNQEEMKAVLAKKEILYVGGLVRYKDRNGTDDSLPFAYEYDPPSDTWIPNSDLSKLFSKK